MTLNFTIKSSEPEQRVLCFSDLHFPAHSEEALSDLMYLIQQVKPTKIVNQGDVFDNRELSRWHADDLHECMRENSGKSMPETYKEGVELHDSIIDKAPKGCEVIVIHGNHDFNTDKYFRKLRFALDGYNPMLAAWQNSRHINKILTNYPSNNYILFDNPFVICSHGGKGTNGNHAKSTWKRDFHIKHPRTGERASRIYGHAHDPQHYLGMWSINHMERDERFAIALGAMVDRDHLYMHYASREAREQWRPTALVIEVSNGIAHFEQFDLTPDEIGYDAPQLLGQTLNASI
jgi:predicted phosphodiesterase